MRAQIKDQPTLLFLDRRIDEIRKMQARPSEAVSVHLRTRALERGQVEAQARLAKSEATAKSQQLLQQEKNAKIQPEIAKVEKSTALATAQKKLEEARLA